MRMSTIARGALAVSAASLAAVTLKYAELAPLGHWLPGWPLSRVLGTYGPSVVLLAASAGLCASRSALLSAIAIAAYHALSLLVGIPSILAAPFSIGAWYPFCEALTALAGAIVVYGLLRREAAGSRLPVVNAAVVRASQALFGLTCVFYGWSHFTYADYTASMVPAWLPAHMGFAYFTGMGHVAAGIGIALSILPKLAATLEALMMSLFGLLVWLPTLWAEPRPKWAAEPMAQLDELAINVVLVAAALAMVASLWHGPWGQALRDRSQRPGA